MTSPTASKTWTPKACWAQLCFPNFGGFAGSTFHKAEDKDFAKLCISAYNDFILDEWCGYAPERQIPSVMVPFWDIDASVAEIQRTAAKGAKSVSFIEAPHKLGLPSFHTDHWDPILLICWEAGLPLSMHFGSGGMPQGLAPDGDMFISIALFGLNSMMATVDLLMSDVFYKFPNLKVALSEGGIGWMPYLLERIDYSWGRHKYWCNINADKLPSELFREHIYGCLSPTSRVSSNGTASGSTTSCSKATIPIRIPTGPIPASCSPSTSSMYRTMRPEKSSTQCPQAVPVLGFSQPRREQR